MKPRGNERLLSIIHRLYQRTFRIFEMVDQSVTNLSSIPLLFPIGHFYSPIADAEFLYAALCHLRPKTMVEVGNEFSDYGGRESPFA